MIMSAIFIETFFSTCGACAPADAVNASESNAMPRNLPVNDMFYSLSERSSWRDLRLQHHSDLDISPSPLGALMRESFRVHERARVMWGAVSLSASTHLPPIGQAAAALLAWRPSVGASAA